MDILIAYENDPAGHNMAKFISREMEKEGDIYKGKYFDLAIIQTPAISADWLEEKFDYDGYIFLSIFQMPILEVIVAKFPFRTHTFKSHTFRIFGMHETSFHSSK